MFLFSFDIIRCSTIVVAQRRRRERDRRLRERERERERERLRERRLRERELLSRRRSRLLELELDADLERERSDLLLPCITLGSELLPNSLNAAAEAAFLSKATSAEPVEAEGWAGLLGACPKGAAYRVRINSLEGGGNGGGGGGGAPPT